VQEAAPTSHRARVMSVYSLGMMGGMPIGSFAMGYVISAFGASANETNPCALVRAVQALLVTKMNALI